jgi:hypothetical protein
MSLELIRHEAEMLYNQTNGDLAGVAHFVNKVHGVSYSENDVLRIIQGKEPRKKYTRTVSPELFIQSKAKSEEPIGWHPPIATPKKDPLVVALKAYPAKYADTIQEALHRGY